MQTTPTLSRELQAEIMRTALTDHERNLLRLRANGKSLEGIAKLYRQYEGENGVQEALDEVAAKIKRAAERRLERASTQPDTPVNEAAREAAGEEPGERREDNETTLPSKAPSEPSAKIADAGAETVGRTASPSSHASAPAQAPAADPSPASSASPAPARELSDGQARALALLATRRMSAKALGIALEITDGARKQLVLKLCAKGLIERTEMNAYDWPGAVRGGRPSRVWKLVEESPDCEMLDASMLAAASTPAVRNGRGGGR